MWNVLLPSFPWAVCPTPFHQFLIFFEAMLWNVFHQLILCIWLWDSPIRWNFSCFIPFLAMMRRLGDFSLIFPVWDNNGLMSFQTATVWRFIVWSSDGSAWSVRNAVIGLCAYLVDRGCGFLESYINWCENALLPFLPSTHLTHHSPLSTTIPTFDIMSSFNNTRPALRVSTTPVDQEGAIPNAWNQMRASVRPMILEVSDVFQQSLLIVS